jgi:hypothetical protein
MAVEVGTRRTPPGTVVGASVVLLVKAALGLWAAFALLTASRAHRRSFLGGTVRVRHAGLGSLLLVLAVVSVVFAVALLRLVRWSRVATFVLEGVGIVVALARLVSHPGSSLFSLALSVVIVGLLLLPASAAAFARTPT